ncbi:MAG: plasmid related protein [Chloroflexia bacterium]|nr:plasmid related protein [Chloroflexia bacterium]
MVMTPGADLAMRTARQVPLEFLLRHKYGDRGELPPEDVRENEWSLQNGARLFSAYRTRTDEKLWVITEWDRSVTTLLLSEEY